MSFNKFGNADFTPSVGNYKSLSPFRYWCQKVLPLVYDNSLSYYELLCKVVDYLNKCLQDVETLHGDVTSTINSFTKLQDYVNTYFKNLDVQEEINKKLDEMSITGELSSIIYNFLTCEIYQPRLSTTNSQGSATIYKSKLGNILIDCGLESQSPVLGNFIDKLGITRFDCVIITHWDSDHAGGAPEIIKNYCDKRTVVFRQMDCDFSKFENGVNGEANCNAVLKAMRDKGLEDNLIIPKENDTYKIEGFTLNFLNTDTNNLTDYYDARDENVDGATLNNLSLITTVTVSGATILDCGDIEFTAQKNYADKVAVCDIMKIPHHCVNLNGYHYFFDKANPRIGYANYNVASTSFKNTFIAKYLNFIRNFPVLVTQNGDVSFKLVGGAIISSGETFAKKIDTDLTVRDVIPSPYHDVTTYALNYANWTITDLYNMLSKCPKPVWFLLPSTSTCTTLVDQINSMFQTKKRDFKITSESGCMIYQTTPNLKVQKIQLFSGVTFDTFPARTIRYALGANNTSGNVTTRANIPLYPFLIMNVTIDGRPCTFTTVRDDNNVHHFNFTQSNESGTQLFNYDGTIGATNVDGWLTIYTAKDNKIERKRLTDVDIVFNYFIPNL